MLGGVSIVGVRDFGDCGGARLVPAAAARSRVRPRVSMTLIKKQQNFFRDCKKKFSSPNNCGPLWSDCGPLWSDCGPLWSATPPKRAKNGAFFHNGPQLILLWSDLWSIVEQRPACDGRWRNVARRAAAVDGTSPGARRPLAKRRPMCDGRWRIGGMSLAAVGETSPDALESVPVTGLQAFLSPETSNSKCNSRDREALIPANAQRRLATRGTSRLRCGAGNPRQAGSWPWRQLGERRPTRSERHPTRGNAPEQAAAVGGTSPQALSAVGRTSPDALGTSPDARERARTRGGSWGNVTPSPGGSWANVARRARNVTRRAGTRPNIARRARNVARRAGTRPNTRRQLGERHPKPWRQLGERRPTRGNAPGQAAAVGGTSPQALAAVGRS